MAEPPAGDALVGKQVKVTLGENLAITGELLSYEDDLAVLDLGGGNVFRVMPVLDIEEVPGE